MSDERPTKTVKDSQHITTRTMMPADANPQGNVYGGAIVHYIDGVAAVVAKRHAHKNVVTASIDRVDFHEPVYVGDLLILKASLNYAHRTSMEVGVRAEVEDLRSGNRVHTGSAYLTFVALDDRGKPTPVPRVDPGTEEERRRYEEARKRRERRLAVEPGANR